MQTSYSSDQSQPSVNQPSSSPVIQVVVLLLFLGGIAYGAYRYSVHQQAIAEFKIKLLQTARKSDRAQLELRHVLLSGDSRAADRVAALSKEVDDDLVDMQNSSNVSYETQGALREAREFESLWLKGFALPLIDKRKRFDGGQQGSLPELQITYLQMDPENWEREIDNKFEKITTAIER